MTRYRLPAKPSLRALRNNAKGMRALYLGEPMGEVEVAKPRKRSSYEAREESSNDRLKDWRRTRGDVRIWRNNVGAYQYAPGKYLRYGLCNGSADFIGLYSMIVRPEHVGKRVAIFFAPESKARGKDADSHQETWLQEIIDAGGIAGVARNGDEADRLIAMWELTI